MRATINVGDVAIELEGTLTEVLCFYDALGDEKPEIEVKNTREWINKFSKALFAKDGIDFFGKKVMVMSQRINYSYEGAEHVFEFSDGNKISLVEYGC